MNLVILIALLSASVIAILLLLRSEYLHSGAPRAPIRELEELDNVFFLIAAPTLQLYDNFERFARDNNNNVKLVIEADLPSYKNFCDIHAAGLNPDMYGKTKMTIEEGVATKTIEGALAANLRSPHAKPPGADNVTLAFKDQITLPLPKEEQLAQDQYAYMSNEVAESIQKFLEYATDNEIEVFWTITPRNKRPHLSTFDGETLRFDKSPNENFTKIAELMAALIEKTSTDWSDVDGIPKNLAQAIFQYTPGRLDKEIGVNRHGTYMADPLTILLSMKFMQDPKMWKRYKFSPKKSGIKTATHSKVKGAEFPFYSANFERVDDPHDPVKNFVFDVDNEEWIEEFINYLEKLLEETKQDGFEKVFGNVMMGHDALLNDMDDPAANNIAESASVSFHKESSVISFNNHGDVRGQTRARSRSPANFRASLP